MACGNDQFSRVCRIRRAKGIWFARNAGIDLAILRVHSKVVDSALWHISLYRRFGRKVMCGPNNKVPVDARRRVGAIRQFSGRYISRRMRVADWWLGHGAARTHVKQHTESQGASNYFNRPHFL
jgi:hypothetical protein